MITRDKNGEPTVWVCYRELVEMLGSCITISYLTMITKQVTVTKTMYDTKSPRMQEVKHFNVEELQGLNANYKSNLFTAYKNRISIWSSNVDFIVDCLTKYSEKELLNGKRDMVMQARNIRRNRQ